MAAETFLNSPPTLPPFPEAPGQAPVSEIQEVRSANGTPIKVPFGPPGAPVTTEQVSAAIERAGASDPPVMEDPTTHTVDLPAGYLDSSNQLYTTAVVRELTGYDEERLAKFNMQQNVAKYVTELVLLGVEEIGGQKPTKEVIRHLLIGDRDQLVLGIRRATYGDDVEFELNCSECDSKSAVNIELDKDVPVVNIEDPMVRVFDVELRNGAAKVALLTGVAQEAFSEGIGKKSSAEIATLMLAHSVVEINGVPTNGDPNAVRALSSADRQTIRDFNSEHQPGPQITEIPVSCATCGQEYPILLGLPTLFRF